MLKQTILLVLIVVLVCAAPSTLAGRAAAAEVEVAALAGPLADYVAKEDKSYQWTKRREGKLGDGDYVELTLTSQTWKDIVWKHQLFIYKPAKIDSDKQALLWIDGGRWNDDLAKPPMGGDPGSKARLLAGVGDQMQCPVAVLLHVPQQPIFDGLVEDEIISLTFARYSVDRRRGVAAAAADGQKRRARHGRGAGIHAQGMAAQYRAFHGHRRLEARLDNLADIGGRSARDGAGADGDRHAQHDPADEASGRVVRNLFGTARRLHLEGIAELSGDRGGQEARRASSILTATASGSRSPS